MSTTLADVLTYARNTGRVVIEVDGDSTGERDGGGHAAGITCALMQLAQCAGVITPPNHTSDNNETQGLYEARRHNNGATIHGVDLPDDLVLPGYPVAMEEYGVATTPIGIRPPASTVSDGGDGLTAIQTTIVLADGSTFEDPGGTSIGWVLIDKELISYTDRSTNSLTGCTRGVHGTTAATHAEGATVKQVGFWQSPMPAYLASTLIDDADGITDADTTITVDSTDAFQSAGRIKIESEIIQYTGKTATTFTGCTRGNLSTVAAAHADNAVVHCALNAGTVNGLMYQDHPLGVSCNLKHATFYMSLSAGSVSGATMTPRLASQATAINTDTTYTQITLGSAFNFTGTAVGTINKDVQNGAAASRGTVSLFFGSSSGANGLGPFGPGAVLGSGLFAGARAKGFIQAMGISRGAQTLSAMLYDLDKWNVTLSQNRYYNGLVARYKMYLQCGDASVGGNGAVALLHVAAFGHNETGGGGYGGPVDENYGWTVATSDTLADATLTDTDTTINVGVIGSFQGSNALIKIDDEIIFYTAQSGGQFTGCIRGVFGTVPAAHTIGATVYQGYVEYNPLGFIATLKHDYELHRTAWIAAGGTAATFYYLWPRPIPVSATATYISHNTIPTGSGTDQEKLNKREARYREFVAAARQHLTGFQNFIVIDALDVMTGGETVTNENGSDGATDVIHNYKSFYRSFWARAAAFNTYGAGAGGGAIGGGPFRGLRGRHR